MTDVAVGRRERKKEETRRRIFVAAVQLFRDKGFEPTTVDEITERADVAKGTFFNYFPHKESVLGYLGDSRLAELEEQASHDIDRSLPAAERLSRVFQMLAGAYEEDRNLSLLVMMESMKRMFCPEDDAVHERFHRLVEAMVREGSAAGEFGAKLDPARAVHVLGSVYMGTVVEWLCRESGWSLKEEVARRLALVVAGLAAAGGAAR